MKGSSVTNTAGAQWAPQGAPRSQHSSSPGTHEQSRSQRGSRPESLAQVGQQHLQDMDVLLSQGRPPSPKSHTGHGSYHSGTGSAFIPQMEEDVSNNNRPSSTKLSRQVELQFVVQNLVMVWVGGHTWEAQSDFFVKSLVHSVKLPQILCIPFTSRLQIFAWSETSSWKQLLYSCVSCAWHLLDSLEKTLFLPNHNAIDGKELLSITAHSWAIH